MFQNKDFSNIIFFIFKQLQALINGQIEYIFTFLFDNWFCFQLEIVAESVAIVSFWRDIEDKISLILKRNLTTIYLASFPYIYDVYGSHLNHLSISRTDTRQSVNCRKRAHNKCLDFASYFEKSRGHLIWLQYVHYKMVSLISLKRSSTE